MKIAIMGTRGIPACYGGFETFAEELAVRLAARGHDVTVYCRSRYSQGAGPSYRGVHRVVLPAVAHKYLDTVSHAFVSVVHGLFCGYDVLLMCNAVNVVFTALARLSGQRVAVNVDGIERQRRKWNWLGKLVYQVSERLVTWLPNVLIADARVIEEYYRGRYGARSVVIPYGAPLISIPPGDALRRWSLQSRNYLLYVSRLEPENHAHTTIEAFLTLETALPLVIVGDAPYSGQYIATLRRATSERLDTPCRGQVLFTGAVYGPAFEELISNALLYVQATEVGGTHPALLQAMGAGNLVIANDTPEHREVLGPAGLYYRRNDPGDLACQMRDVLREPHKFEGLRSMARVRVEQHYSWESVTSQYEGLFERMVKA